MFEFTTVLKKVNIEFDQIRRLLTVLQQKALPMMIFKIAVMMNI
jgi:hypothetical protein